ncbi:MAG TPA: GMP synthase (glutamine-hydrolyzing), partial [Candidatus Melainabacteria bacterium]|nr:GMP synthase (glutamine-hydrolyzing) [Candidatus Melainabacteria bacterium]
MPFSVSAEELKRLNPKGIILSGGPNSCYDEGAPRLDKDIWALGLPVLGVCYGMQLMARDLDGDVTPAKESEYGRALLTVVEHDTLFEGVEPAINSWMSHGDSVSKLPPGF